MNDEKKKILVVEDDTALRNIMNTTLTDAGYELVVAENGKEGLDAALRIHPDLIILDLEMPVMNGIEALKKLREDEWGKSALVLVLTNSGSPETIFEAVNSGILQYMEKANVDMQELVKEVANALASKNHQEPRAVKGSFGVAPTS